MKTVVEITKGKKNQKRLYMADHIRDKKGGLFLMELRNKLPRGEGHEKMDQ